MHLSKFVHSSTGKYIMSMIMGLGLATLFRQACKGAKCRMLNAPPLDELDDETYKISGKCYNFEKNPVKCNKSKRILPFA
uniref:Uncharacterized protein n=1 Tax=viral metagenome TaxID=1070528 RepID=A0A6C0ITF9_9ZZZZ